MAGNFQVKSQIEGKKINAELSGAINEDASLEQIPSGFEQYVFDFNNVNLINSCGIRDWIGLLDRLGSNVKITYKRCPQIIIEQINMVKGFIRPNTSIENFYAPYFDPEPDQEIKVLIKTSDIQNGKAPVMKNGKGEPLEFDAIEDQYFFFLKNK